MRFSARLRRAAAGLGDVSALVEAASADPAVPPDEWVADVRVRREVAALLGLQLAHVASVVEQAAAAGATPEQLGAVALAAGNADYLTSVVAGLDLDLALPELAWELEGISSRTPAEDGDPA